MKNDKLASGGTAAPAEQEGVRQPTANRDPRINPLPGDVLRKKYQGQYFESRGYITREVAGIGEHCVSFFGRFENASEVVTFSAWRKWAKDATVERSAVEPSTAGRSAAPPEAKESEQEGA